MLYKFKRIALCALLLLFTVEVYQQSDSTEPLQVINEMLDVHSKVNSLEMVIEMKERIGGEMNNKKAYFKIAYNPDRVYLKQDMPRKGLEVLYVDGENNNNAWVYPNSFPWFTLSLDPYGSLMRHDHHHSVFNAGYKFTMEIVKYLVTKYKTRINEVLTYNGTTKFKNIECYVIEFNSPDFKYYNYEPKPGETIVSIAKKLHLNEYMIIEKNNGNIGYEESLGEKILVPSDYAKRVTFYINTANNLPYKIEIFDDKGLFESYTFTNVKVNPVFTPDEFSVDYTGYNF